MAIVDTREHRFANAAALTEALALEIASALQNGLAAGRAASLAVPGGRTPVALFEMLSSAELDWDDMDALGAAFASEIGQAAAADVPKFAPTGVRSLVYEVEEL